MHVSAVPLFHRVFFIQPVEIFMVAVHEQCRKRFLLQPFEQIPFLTVLAALTPNPAEIPADDDKIILRHLLLFREDPRIESPKIPMAVAGNINHSAPHPFPEK